MKRNEHWNTDQIRQYNRALVLHFIYKHGPISKAEIAEKTDLTFATISNITSELEEMKAINTAGYGKSNGGRKPLLYEFHWDQYYTIALDIGVTKVQAAIVDFKGKIHDHFDMKMSAFAPGTTLIDKTYTVIDQLLENTTLEISKLVGIGVSAPGPIDQDGVILTPPNLEGVENVNIKDSLEKRYKLITVLEKDANAAALAEQWFGNVRPEENILYLFADQGIGGGMIVNARIYRGFRNGAGEIGHMSIDTDGPRCNCGNFGCLESFASGISVIKRIKKELRRGATSSLSDLYLQNEESLTLDTIVEHGKNGDSLVEKVFEETGRYLGLGIKNAMNFFAPTMVIFGGQMIELRPELIKMSEDIAKKRAFSAFANDVTFVQTSFAEQSCLIGAAAIIQQRLFDEPESHLI